MNNKFVYCIVLFFTSSLIASEHDSSVMIPEKTPSLTESENSIEAFIQVQRTSSRKKDFAGYMIIGTYKPLSFGDVNGSVRDRREFGFASSKGGEVGYPIDIKGFSTYHGTKTDEANILISMDNRNSLLFRQRIKDGYELYKKDKYTYFYMHFLKKQDQSDVISLVLTQDQVEEIISMKKPSAMRSMLVSLGVAGFITFLMWYLDLYSKGMALLGRG